MNIKPNRRAINQSNVRNIEAEAFFKGSQKIVNDHDLAGTQADFEQLKAAAEREATDEIWRLEGSIAVSGGRKDEAESRWIFWNRKTEGIAPHFFKFLGLVCAGFLMLGGETMLLQRIADAFGVAEPFNQFIVVGVIVLLLATLVESVVCFWKHNFNRTAVYVYGSLVLMSLIALGVYRAFILQILEAAGDPDLSQLYDETSYLNKFVMIVLTAGLPIGATFAFEYGWFGLSRWKQWHSARRSAVKFKKKYEILVKERDAAVEKLGKRLTELDETCVSWQSAQRQAHAEGARLTPQRRPWWEIMPVLSGGALLIFFGVMLICYLIFDGLLLPSIESDTGRFALYLLLAGGLILLFAAAVLKRWNSPTPAQFYKERTVRWEPSEIKSIPETRLPPDAETQRLERSNGKFAQAAG